jgi:hypothetical protein
MTTPTQHFGRWATAIAWLVLPFVAGPSFGDALDPRSRSVQLVATIGLWGFWAIGLVAALVPSTVSLTAIRVLAPASIGAAAWAALVVPHGASAPESVALGMTTLATVIALSAPVGDRMVNGSSYGDERRMPLRPPGVLLLGPLELTWLVVVAGIVAGPMLLAAHQWITGAVALVVGWALGGLGVRILHRLSQRWFVFVPAGVVIVDQMALTDSLLVQRQRVDSIGPAPVDTQAVDLTVGALGLALELRLTEPDLIIPAPPRRFGGGQATIDPVEVESVLFAPTRPGWVLSEATRRRLLVD